MTYYPPCQWIVAHLGEVPVRCGDHFAAWLGGLPVCIDHYQMARLHPVDA